MKSTTPAVEGTTLIRELVARVGAEEVGRKTRTTPKGVNHWTSGRRLPGAAAQQLLADHFALPLSAWRTTTRAKPPSSAASSTPAPAESFDDIAKGISARDRVHAQIERIRHRIAAADRSERSPRDIAALETTLTSALRLYSRLSGELEITEATILRSSAWARVAAILRDAAAPYPDASRAIGMALQRLGETG